MTKKAKVKAPKTRVTPKTRTATKTNAAARLDKDWMTETAASEAATAIARAWLAKAGFHEDPTRDSPERIEIKDAGWDDGEHYVDVRVYVPALDIEHVVDGTHPDGITAEAS
jgi:hypothetical protein